MKSTWIVTVMLMLVLCTAAGAVQAREPEQAAASVNTYLPIACKPKPPTPTPTPGACQPIPGVSYGTLSIAGAPSSLPAEQHPDLNLALRGYVPATGQSVGLVDNCGSLPDDTNAPQLRGLFGDHRIPTFRSVYWVRQWDWANHRPLSSYEDRWGPALLRVAVTPGEILRVPASGYSIDDALGYEVLVLYAGEGRITLKYTREDNVIAGYTLHLEGICVEPSLLALYRAANAAGRGSLPALRAGDLFCRAQSSELGIVIRDRGEWMNPRNCADWWRQ